MGNACGKNLPVVSKCSASNFDRKVLPCFLTMEMASACLIEVSGECQFRFSCLGSKGKLTTFFKSSDIQNGTSAIETNLYS